MQPTQLDPDAVNLSKAIRQTESGGNFTAKGKSGEYGAYQYTEPTWMKDSAAAGVHVPLSQATPEQQNQVAYTKIKSLKDAGHNVGEIASIWNSGDSQAYTGKFSTGKAASGTNGYGVKYDVPAYAKSVATAYQKLKSGGQVNADPNNPSSTAAPETPKPQSFGDKIIGGVKAVGNFLAPIVPDVYHDIKGDSTKTGMQQLGDLGSTALTAATLVPGLGPEALAAKAGLTGAEGLGLAGRLGTNAAIGAGFGATNALGSGETDPNKIAKSAGAGGLLGGGLSVAGEAAGGLLNKVAEKNPTSQLEEHSAATQRMRKAVSDNSRPATATSEATTPIKTFDQKGFTQHLKVKDSKVNVDALTNDNHSGLIDNAIEEHADDASALVDSMKGGVPTDHFKEQVIKAVSENPDIKDSGNVSKAVAEIERKFADLKNSYGEVLPWKAVDSIRKTMNKDYALETRDVSRSIGDTARKFLYDGGEIPEGMLPSVSLNQGGANKALKTAMQNEAELIRARNFAEKLKGTPVKGGRLGKYFWDLIGAGAGGAIGGMGGPFTGGIGTVVGGLAADKGRQSLEEGYFNPLRGRTAGKIKGILNKPVVKGAKNLAKVGLLKSVK